MAAGRSGAFDKISGNLEGFSKREGVGGIDDQLWSGGRLPQLSTSSVYLSVALCMRVGVACTGLGKRVVPRLRDLAPRGQRE